MVIGRNPARAMYILKVSRTQSTVYLRVGKEPDFPTRVAKTKGPAPEEIFFYVISGHKVANPAAAMAVIERVKK